MSAKVITIGEEPDPDKRLRKEWGDNLTGVIEAHGWTRKQFRHELEKAGVEVSRQTVDYWCSGQWSPKPQHMAVVAQVTGVPVHVLFPIKRVA